MSERSAVDTNVVIHLHDVLNPPRQAVVEKLMAQKPLVSAQVVSEYFNVLQRRLHISKKEALLMGIDVFADCEIIPTTHATLANAARLLARYDFQLFDALIVAAALDAGCTVLYSVDFQHQQLIEGRLRLLNPFR